MKLPPRVELAMRSLGIFLGVYFTIGWGEKAEIKHDIPILMTAIAAALILRWYD
jgi:hypothetical protein